MPEKPGTILVVELGDAPEPAVSAALAEERARSVAVRGVGPALAALDDGASDAVLVDAGSNAAGALELLRAVQERWPGMPVVLAGDAPDVAEVIALGASDLVSRPVSAQQLSFSLRKALAVARRSAAAPPPPLRETGIVFGQSPPMQELRALLGQVAPTSSTALVRGESGTGKELVARALHRLSPRTARPFIKIDCTSLPETLIESELFGYERGAFTGAASQKPGRVELADTGTLFLDEVGELPLVLQAKLLRLLQDREFERLGGRETLRVDVRVVAATHRDLETMVEQGTFRRDLFYRLNVVPLWIPPLRARRVDVTELAEHFCAELARANGKPDVRLEPAALKTLSSQRWPGNVRQLQNFVERLVVLCKGTRIGERDVQAELARPVRFATETGTAGADAADGPHDEKPAALDAAVKKAEIEALRRAVEQAQGNRSAAARLLGVSRTTLYAKLEEYGLS